MKSPKVKGIGEVVTEYGAKVMKIFKKGLLQRSLFDFYGDVKANAIRVKESSSVPQTPIDNDGGVVYVKNSDGKLYYKSNEVSEVEISASDTNTQNTTTLSFVDSSDDILLRNTTGGAGSGTDDIKFVAGANITLTHTDADNITIASTDTNTTYSIQDGELSQNNFTNADHTKLDGIEASADVTDTTNVTAAGALMDSELTDLAGVKGVTISTLQVKPSEGAFANGDKTKLDSIEASATADQTQSDINALGITAIGVTGTTDSDVEITSDGEVTIKLDSDNDETNQKFKVVNNSGTERFSINESGVATFTGDITVNEKITNTGTNNDLTLETDGSMTFVIDRDNDETSQSFSFKNFNVEVANLDESGNLQIDGDLTVTGNDIKDSGGNSIISSDGSGVVTMAGGNISVGGSNANLEMNSGSDIILEADNNGGGNTSTIQYPDSGGTNRIILGADSNVAILSNRASNGTVQIRANTSTAGGSGEVTVVTVEDDKVTISQDLDVTGNVLPGLTYIKILHSDFIADDVGRPAQIDDTGSDRWLKSHDTAKLYASVEIPIGFKATHVDLYGSGTSAVTVYEADVNSKTVTSKGTGNIGTQINITDVTADATNYLLIELAQTSSEEVYGGKITIAKA